MAEIPPVFLTPMGRTGGTLLVTMLDAHPDLAMSYEIYEDRLLDEQGRPLSPRWIIDGFERARDAAADPASWIKAVEGTNIQVFFYRARRAGLEVDVILEEIRALAEAGGTLETLDGRLDLIERLMDRKMRQVGKRAWGGKAKVDPRALHRRHPDASFLAMVRDGRDVLASMMHTGDFDTEPEKVAADWVRHLEDFRAFCAEQGVRGLLVSYERLVREPEPVLREVCSFIGVPYAAEMLAYHERDMPLFRNPHGHLSYRQIARGLNAESIGRWRRDLTESQVESFARVAGPLLQDLGYSGAEAEGSRRG
jgi:hypothetical protein